MTRHIRALKLPSVVVLLFILTVPIESFAIDIVREYDFKIIQRYPHSPQVFTQGLEYREGLLYEGAGKVGESMVLKRRLASVEPVRSAVLAEPMFGEGITILDQRLYQLTWQSRRGFIYDAESLTPTGEFEIRGEGWGLTNNGRQLIMSDGSNSLIFLDPENFEVVKELKVRYHGKPLDMLNELEWIDGVIYANVWLTDWIVMIDPDNGKVIGQVSLAGLLPANERTDKSNVLNGIAYDDRVQRLFITGKYWPLLFEVELVSLER